MTSRDLLMAYRWPAAVVLSSLVLAVTAAKLLSRPIPIAIKGGLQVDKLVLPPSVTIRSDTPLPVVVQEQVTIGGAAPLAIEGPVTISGNAPLAVEGAVSVTAEDPLAVRADVSVDNKVTIGGKVDIQGKVKPTLLPVPGSDQRLRGAAPLPMVSPCSQRLSCRSALSLIHISEPTRL